MTAPQHDVLQEAMAELQRTRQRLTALRSEMAEASTTVSSKDKMISVTVDGRGAVTGITFQTAKWRRMAPAELGAALVSTIAAARQEAMERAADKYQPVFPAGMPARQLLSGRLDLDKMFADVVRRAGEPMPGEPRPA